MQFAHDNDARAEAYRMAAEFFAAPPDQDVLEAVRRDFHMKSTESGDEVRADFERLFSYSAGAARPVESAFLAASGEPASSDVMEYYEKAGLTFDEELDLVPDNLTIELLFMSYLCETGDVEMQESFFAEHLLSWVPDYCESLAAEAADGYYSEIASVVREFIEMEAEELSE